MKSYKYVILGGGVAAGYAARTFVEKHGQPGELCIVSADDTLPYERPPLTKGYLAGKKEAKSILINSREFYEEHGIDILLNTPVEEVDTHDRLLILQSGDSIEYASLMIATGATPRHLDVPGCLLNGIYYMRTFDDAHMICTKSKTARRAVVIGGGFIGMETAATLTGRGLDVTLVFPEDRVWKKVFTPEMSAFFEKYYRRKGVRLLSGASIVGFEGHNDHVTRVLFDMEDPVEADIVVAGIGVELVTDIVEGSGISVRHGIVVDEYLTTSVKEVYAVGDVAEYYDVIFDKRRNIEHWDNAVAQAQCAMESMMGTQRAFVHVPYFFSDVFDLSYEFWGDTSGADEIVYRGDPTTKSFSVWWLKDQILVAAFIMNRPDEEREAVPEWIECLQKLSSEALRDTSQPIAEAVMAGEKVD